MFFLYILFCFKGVHQALVTYILHCKSILNEINDINCRLKRTVSLKILTGKK